jgi:4'-phosphopantetheinyl transferase EntD
MTAGGYCLKCISPIDGEVYAERPVMALEAQRPRPAVARPRGAEGLGGRPLAERIALVKAGVDALNAMGDEVVPNWPG